MAALFKKSPMETPAPAPGRDIGLLGLDSRFKGSVRFAGTLTIDGMVEGGITSAEGSGATLIVNQNAAVIGDIVADSVLISGKVTGNIKARTRVEIFSAGTLTGNVHTGDIMIEGGARFQGFCHMLREQPQAKAASVSDAATPAGNGAGESGPVPAEPGPSSRAAAR